MSGDLAAVLERDVCQEALVPSHQDAVDQGRWLEPVEVTNIRNNRDYLRCMEYLQSLNLVNRVHIVSVQGERIHFQLELNAAPEYLHESIDRGDFLNLVGASMHAEARIYEMATP